MKRIEAIALLNKLLYNDDGAFSNVTSDEILKQLESIGMLPPLSKLESLNAYDNSWEPE